MKAVRRKMHKKKKAKEETKMRKIKGIKGEHTETKYKEKQERFWRERAVIFFLICSVNSNFRREPRFDLVRQVTAESDNLASRFYSFVIFEYLSM